MNENNCTKWLQYLLYVGIAALANTILSAVPLLDGLSGWISLAINAATVFLLYKLQPSCERYFKAAIFRAVPLILGILGRLGISVLPLLAALCGIVAEYQEFASHGELIQAWDTKLAGKWSSLFWLQFAVSIITTLLGSVFTAVLVAGGGMDMETATAMLTVVVAMVTLLLDVLYLVYLRKTIRLLEKDVVVE